MTALAGASVLLIAASAIALVFGWITANESLIWTSIMASVGAGVSLALAYFRAREEAPSTTGAVPPAADAQPPPAVAEWPASDEVVRASGSKRFHRPACRYAKGGETMTKADALQRGLIPCGICKP